MTTTHTPLTTTITAKDISQHFRHPINKAASLLGVGVTTLKILCREKGIARWPYRKVLSLEKKIKALSSVERSDDEEVAERTKMRLAEAEKELADILNLVLPEPKKRKKVKREVRSKAFPPELKRGMPQVAGTPIDNDRPTKRVHGSSQFDYALPPGPAPNPYFVPPGRGSYSVPVDMYGYPPQSPVGPGGSDPNFGSNRSSFSRNSFSMPWLDSRRGSYNTQYPPYGSTYMPPSPRSDYFRHPSMSGPSYPPRPGGSFAFPESYPSFNPTISTSPDSPSETYPPPVPVYAPPSSFSDPAVTSESNNAPDFSSRPPNLNAPITYSAPPSPRLYTFTQISFPNSGVVISNSPA
eukprot:TRINITY_DN388_c0_g2_i1.p1 TRINITY_DN388_c0_g2~~TRINITY_DN388_c0_g2_i1.p1  ORF type:complete len:367 (-),score=93.26 TRINITY_DN388_c0_g2_i1:315-1370(-)